MRTFTGIQHNPKREITEIEKQFLIRYYDYMTLKELGKVLNCSDSLIVTFMRELGLKKFGRVRGSKLIGATEYFKHDVHLATI